MSTMTTYRTAGGSGDVTTWWYDEATGLLTNKTYADNHGTAYTYTTGGRLAIFAHAGIPELINLQNVHGQAKPYQIKQFLNLIERYNLQLKD